METTGHTEIEIKLRVKSIAAVKQRLREAGATRLSRVFEHNVLYDLRRQPLRRKGALLRLRREMPVPARGMRAERRKRPARALLTYKSRAVASLSYKIVREIEVEITDPRRLEEILHGAGFRPSFRYEKFRTTFRLKGLPGLLVELDETPIGNFLEMEGSRRGIDSAARLLGYTPREYIKASYAVLHRAFCRSLHRRGGNMLFSRRGK